MISKAICVGIVGMLYGASMALAQTNLDNSQSVLIYNNWVRNIGSTFGLQQSQSVPTDFVTNINTIQSGNLARTPGSYKLGYNSYSATNAQAFQNGHIAGSNIGLYPMNGTNLWNTKGNGIAGGTLAGIIVGSVLGGLLVLVGMISAFISWRRHMELKKSTLYADYRSNYKAEPIPDIKDHVPSEYYRESHRIGLNQGYNVDSVTSTRYRENNNLSYVNRENHEVTIPRTASDINNNNATHITNAHNH
ncbi:hypothetical protein DDB_G0286053 [Dictyostelium discoideum AX4]|uniref:Uncharacterized protein n=1 Tax=Dictyostelium discoideum TaxID=44689 RepID=Q54MB7_DICDI|nr:hypothetical protein DDB_G0286053 [Dictyostelium discoideum AX4]EAL64405.1 hypothetical protein DDB_G0286053 [Dictyostelium discoideum AX4]|eukprot:XP_637917.1 hypothetical protein DDB_G0286053 [Dictyostelium discoideum AX4]